MIVLEIDSGLGNQMFKYAAALALADKHGTELLLDIDIACIEGYGIGQTYQLDKFNISANRTSAAEISSFESTNWVIARYTRVRALIRKFKFIRDFSKNLRSYGLEPSKLLPIGSSNAQKIYHEKDEDWAFKSEFLSLPNDIYVKGYFPSYKYFEHIKEKIFSEFSLKSELSRKSKAIEEEITNSTSIAIHFRRGDVVSNSKYKSWYQDVITENYYRNAIRYFIQKFENPHFFIFSNDIKWVKENFKIPAKTTYVDHNKPESGYEDLHLMSKCKHNVTTGCSSFSWWGAYLNKNPEKIVLRSRRANFHDHLNNVNDYYPPEWVIVES